MVITDEETWGGALNNGQPIAAEKILDTTGGMFKHF
jgi:hypothetical protein